MKLTAVLNSLIGEENCVFFFFHQWFCDVCYIVKYMLIWQTLLFIKTSFRCLSLDFYMKEPLTFTSAYL